MLVSRNGIVRYMNPSAVKLLGEHTGSRVSDMLGSAVSEMPDGATASTWSAGRRSASAPPSMRTSASTM